MSEGNAEFLLCPSTLRKSHFLESMFVVKKLLVKNFANERIESKALFL